MNTGHFYFGKNRTFLNWLDMAVNPLLTVMGAYATVNVYLRKGGRVWPARQKVRAVGQRRPRPRRLQQRRRNRAFHAAEGAAAFSPFPPLSKIRRQCHDPAPVEKIPARSCHNTEIIAGYNIDA